MRQRTLVGLSASAPISGVAVTSPATGNCWRTPREDRLMMRDLCVPDGPARSLLFVSADACQLVRDLIRPPHVIHTPRVNSTDR